MKVFIHLPYGHDARKTKALYEQGSLPDPVSYGFHHAEKHFNDVRYSKDYPQGKLTRFFSKALKKIFRFDVVHAWHNRREIDSSDIIWTMLETEYLAIIFMNILIPWRKKKSLIAQNVWLFNDIENKSAIRRYFYRFLAARADINMTHSEQCLAIMKNYLPETRVHLMHFGVSAETFFSADISARDSRSGPISIFAAGNDRTRDWNVLFDAFGNDERFELTLVCAWIPDEKQIEITNLRLVRNPTMKKFQELYKEADFFLIPMTPNRFSGITVALEAAGLGTPIICSRTGGVPTYFDDSEVIYVEPKNAQALKLAALNAPDVERHAMAARAREAFITKGYSTEAMIGRYAELTHEMLPSTK